VATEEQEVDGLDLLDPSARPHRIRLASRPVAVVVLIVAALLGALLTVVLAPHPVDMTVEARPVSSAGLPPSPSPPVTVFVHIDGAVHSPGIYRLEGGARVIDVVSAAGGFTKEAQRSAANLARLVSDGEQILIPAEGEPVPVAAGQAAATAVVNLNTAGQEQLESLPRVGPALAGRILDWRTEHGRFDRVEDLMSVAGIGQKTFAGLRDRITV
jgi:competence protein ComEA